MRARPASTASTALIVGFELAGVADHVGVGVVHDDGVEFVLLDGFYDRVGDACGRHFGFQIVGRDFGRRHQDAFFAGEGLFDAAVEEIGDVGVFFGFRAAQILVLNVGEDLREDVLEFFGADYVVQPGPVLVVLRHADVEEILRALRVGEFVEVGRG